MIKKTFLLFLKIVAITIALNGCETTTKKTIKPQQYMDTSFTESKKIRALEKFTVELKGRGGLGLQLLFKTDDDSVAAIKRVNNETGKEEKTSPGDAIKIFYEIKGLKKGMVKITFFETQPWNKEFKNIIQKEIDLEVTD